MKFHKDWLKTTWGSLTFAICSGVVLFLVLSNLPTVSFYLTRFITFFRPVFIGIAIAYVVDPLKTLFQNKVLKKIKTEKIRRSLAVTLSILCILLLIILLAVFLIPQLISSITFFVKNLDTYVDSAENMTTQFQDFMFSHGLDISRYIHAFQEWLTSMQSSLPSNVDSVISIARSVGSHIFDGVIALVLAIYFLFDKERLKNGSRLILRATLKPDSYRRTADFLKRGHQILIRYIVFDLLDAVIIGVANFAFMVIVGLPYAALVSVVVGITNLAPTFGPIIGGAIGAFLLLLINPWYALYFLIFTVAIQILDGYVIKPRMFGDALGVPGVIVLICIVVGGKMFGVWGVILAIPVAAIVHYMINEAVQARLTKNGIEAALEAEEKEDKEEEKP